MMNKASSHTNFTIYSSLLLLLLVVLGFIIWQPRIRNFYLPQQQDKLLQAFIVSTKNKGEIDAQEFWQLRDFFSHGKIILHQYYPLDVEQISNELAESLVSTDSFLPYLAVEARRLLSIEGYVSREAIADLFLLEESATILFESDNGLIYEDENEQLIIIHLTTVSQAAKTNGFLWFDSREEDYQPEFEYWLTKTKVYRK
jgi:hypothetical protein